MDACRLDAVLNIAIVPSFDIWMLMKLAAQAIGGADLGSSLGIKSNARQTRAADTAL